VWSNAATIGVLGTGGPKSEAVSARTGESMQKETTNAPEGLESQRRADSPDLDDSSD